MNDINQFIQWIPLIASVFAIVYAVRGGKRTDRQDVAKDAEQTARIETKLDNVWAGVDDIRIEMRSQQKQINDHETRLIKLETRNDIMEKKGVNHE